MTSKAAPAAQLLTVSEVAARLGCSRGHVYHLIAGGLFREITDIGVGRAKTRISESVLAEYIASRTRSIKRTA